MEWLTIQSSLRLVSNHVEVIIITRRPRRCYHFSFALKFDANRHLSFNQINYAFFWGGVSGRAVVARMQTNI